MGVVYEAEHIDLGRVVAVKVLHPALRENERARARFVQEGRVAASLAHPHVIEVVDAGTCEDGPYLVMEFVAGATLAAHLREHGPLSPEQAIRLLLPIVSALAHAHAAGIVHRDVKPANILLARDRFGDALPKIGDFGLGKRLDESGDRSLTRDGMVGSLAYMAPEQIREAKSVDARADQYALGVVLYEAVTGRHPFPEAGAFALMEAICAGRVVPLATVAPGVAPGFAEAVRRAISVRPEDRYPSLAALGRDLMHLSSGRTWSTWAREFAAPGAARSPEDTLDDATPLGPQAAALLRPRRSRWTSVQGLAVPALCFAVGAAGAGVLARARAARGSSTPECASTPASRDPVATNFAAPEAEHGAADRERASASTQPSELPDVVPPELRSAAVRGLPSRTVAAPAPARPAGAPAPHVLGDNNAPILE